VVLSCWLGLNHNRLSFHSGKQVKKGSDKSLILVETAYVDSPFIKYFCSTNSLTQWYLL